MARELHCIRQLRPFLRILSSVQRPAKPALVIDSCFCASAHPPRTYMHAHAGIRTHMHAHARTRTHMHALDNICGRCGLLVKNITFRHSHPWTEVSSSVFLDAHTRMPPTPPPHTHTHTHIHTYTHTHIHTYTHTHIHTYTHTHTHRDRVVLMRVAVKDLRGQVQLQFEPEPFHSVPEVFYPREDGREEMAPLRIAVTMLPYASGILQPSPNERIATCSSESWPPGLSRLAMSPLAFFGGI